MGTQRIRAARVWSAFFAAALLVVVVSGQAVAAAQSEPAPRYDPDSSAGVEYAVPLAQARERAGPKPSVGAAGAAGGADELFGDGITPAQGGGVGDGGRRKGAEVDGQQSPKRTGGSSARSEPAGAGPEPAVAARADAPGISAALVSAIAAAVVALLAGALALLLGRRTTDSGPDPAGGG